MHRKRGGFLMALGLVMLIGAGAWTAWNIAFEEQGGEFAEAAAKKLLQNVQTVQANETADKSTKAADTADTADTAETPLESTEPPVVEVPQMKTTEIDGFTYIGVVSVPTLGIELPVMSEWSYPLLKRSACRFDGSYLDDTLVIAGHSTRKHFRPLRQAQVGDSVVFTDVMGNAIPYQVVAIETLGPKDGEKLITGDWDLTLFTCSPGGERRVTVRCKRVENSAQALGADGDVSLP
jgi:sortase A